ncbi:uncharacterized protein PHALS_11146 [Plasmopara halstedii]|uniref:Uncharacterized protein n=1 Tax=Plasmopara halstedii TaxID=4781 RepID=A0A0P1AI82_PLAHL|nr:uncharacterized protein PHALS_11146 [Plasmopara halstedii]CEG40973.1 hypothetical protein PHALS_11146 [Plasmopara halstedii]|eukprot:XP_024577342.1 hypothetical protein PHALS_11146 [Plasmopara halstedii]
MHSEIGRIFSAASLCDTQTRPIIGIIFEQSAIAKDETSRMTWNGRSRVGKAAIGVCIRFLAQL